MAHSVFRQTRWKRPQPITICQIPDILVKITEYDFDWDDLEFLKYVKARTGMTIKPSSKDVLLPVPDDSKTTTKIIRITLGTLQDCWEVYLWTKSQEKKKEEPVIVKRNRSLNFLDMLGG